MDNVTHSLAGLLLAEAAARLRARVEGAEPSPRFRATAAVSSMIAANLPDADLFYTGIGGDRLRYMLHHRGYSHTIVAALFGAVVLWGATMLVRRWRAGEITPGADARWLLGLLIVSTMSHLVLDWTNSYGVHPFWPVDDGWRYGDAVFIVEPWLWVAAVPALFFTTRSRLGRLLLALVLFGGLALSWRVALVSRGAAMALTSGAVVSVAVALVLRPGTRVMVAIAGWVAVTLMMAAGTSVARAEASSGAHAADPTAQLVDVVVSPLPSNAICASVITVERTSAMYRVAVARVSAAPSIVVAAHCGVRDATGSMLTPSGRTSTPSVQWDGEWSAPTAELVTLARESCAALAALRFIRVPIWRSLGDSAVFLGDVRYGGASGDGFASVRIPRQPRSCPGAIPPWVPPREDVLKGDGPDGRSAALR